MARPEKDGLDYFPLDIDMNMDDKIEIVEAKHGLAAFGLIVRLLMRIYRTGYYTEWTEREQLLFSKRINVDIMLTRDVVNECVNEGFFNREMYEKYSILTSHGIQKRYLKACERRKKVVMHTEYFLLKPGEDDLKFDIVTFTNINVDINSVNVDNNQPVQGGNGELMSTETPQRKVKESKVKESKEDTRARATDDQVVDNLSPEEGNPSSEVEGHGEPDGGSDGELSADGNPDFMTFWKEYPKKTDIGLAAKEWTALTNKGFRASDLVLAAKKYTAYLKKYEKEQFTKKAHKFLAEGTYLEYMPKYRPDCPHCRGSGWKEVEVPEGYRGMTRKMVPCDCEIGGNVSA